MCFLSSNISVFPRKTAFWISLSDINLACLNWAENQPFSIDSHVTFIERRKVVILYLHITIILCALGGYRCKQKMASRTVTDEAYLKLPKTFKEVSNLTKPKLKQICNILYTDFEKSTGKKALVNILCSALKISTSGPPSKDSQRSSSSYADVPSLVDLEKLKDWKKSLDGVPLVMEESAVKEFLIGAGYNQQAVRKYKTLRAWEHKEGIHSVK